jgi:hypothetical protein
MNVRQLCKVQLFSKLNLKHLKSFMNRKSSWGYTRHFLRTDKKTSTNEVFPLKKKLKASSFFFSVFYSK